MSPEAQRIAIAAACGWARNGSSGNDEYPWVKPVNGVAKSLPDYIHDLNAMHDAEKLLNIGQRISYYLALVEANRGDDRPDIVSASATAAQRAEAFLKTLNLYK
jgi:hypothetical protein